MNHLSRRRACLALVLAPTTAALTACDLGPLVGARHEGEASPTPDADPPTTPSATPTPDQELTIDGSTVTIRLPENQTTTWRWRYSMDPEGILTVVSEDYTPDDNPDGMAGVGGTKELVLTAAADGDVVLTLEHGPMSEDDPRVDDTRVYELTVAGGLIEER